MICSFPGEVIQPRLTVVQTPEGYSLYGVCMPAEQGKKLAIFLGLAFEDFGRAGGFVRVILCEFPAVLTIVSPPFTSQHNVYVQFGYYHFKTGAFYEIDCRFQVFVWDLIEFKVALDSYCVDRDFAVSEV